jgi:peptidoglycan/xylan/chitin deacetylase (PgdA/CDA1 family)
MFFHDNIKGDRLPPRTLCLTFDDGPGDTPAGGPGPQTRELGRYLYENGIKATFFVIGRHAEGRADILRDLKNWGHLVGNHTYSHPCVVDLVNAGGNVVGELSRTDEVIRPHVLGDTIFFRAPHGLWRESRRPNPQPARARSVVAKILRRLGRPVLSRARNWVRRNPRAGRPRRPASVVAEVLNRSGKFPRYVGPVHWDIDATDWDYWGKGMPARNCAQEYLSAVERIGKGIVLMHDSSAEPELRANNLTLPMIKLVVPALRQRGYRFVRLDAIPQVRSAARVTSQVALRTGDQQVVCRCEKTDRLLAQGETEGAGEVFGVVPLGGNHVALRAGNGQYVSAEVGGGGPILACSPTIGPAETLEVEDHGGKMAAFRTAAGGYFSRNAKGPGELVARPAGAHQKKEVFELVSLFGG